MGLAAPGFGNGEKMRLKAKVRIMQENPVVDRNKRLIEPRAGVMAGQRAGRRVYRFGTNYP